jgi:hypothetical protein
MNENLKTLRILHQVLMATCAAIMAFAIPRNLANDYRAALDELTALKSISFDQWGTFLVNRYPKEQQANEIFVRSIVRQAGLKMQAQTKLSQPVFWDQPPNSPTLLEYDAFFSGQRKIGALQLVGNKADFAEQLKSALLNRNPQPKEILGMNLSGFAGQETPLVNGNRMMDWRNPPPMQTTTITFIYQPQTSPYQPLFIVVPYKMTLENGPFAIEWLKGDTFGRKMIDPQTGIVFPHLKIFWNRVSGLPPEMASVFIENELEASTRGSLSFFGIPVERSVAISAGPAITFRRLVITNHRFTIEVAALESGSSRMSSSQCETTFC